MACKKSFTITPKTLAVNINEIVIAEKGHYTLTKDVSLNIVSIRRSVDKKS